MIPLDYATPQPPERERYFLSAVTGRFFTGLLIGLAIFSLFEGYFSPLICGGIYSLLPMAIFYFTTLIRRFCSPGRVEERKTWLTILVGVVAGLIEILVFYWSTQTTDRDALPVTLTAWFLLPIISSFASVRRQ